MFFVCGTLLSMTIILPFMSCIPAYPIELESFLRVKSSTDFLFRPHKVPQQRCKYDLLYEVVMTLSDVKRTACFVVVKLCPGMSMAYRVCFSWPKSW